MPVEFTICETCIKNFKGNCFFKVELENNLKFIKPPILAYEGLINVNDTCAKCPNKETILASLPQNTRSKKS